MIEVSYKIISNCGGLPLAIVTIASMLANESNIREKLEQLHDSLPSTSKGTEDGLKLMYKSLPHLIYNCLPPRLRTCLLYLSMYPHGYVIKKDELVNQWVAEGFLTVVGREEPEEIAESYFDELVSRGMLQAMETNNNGDVLSCTVHQMVLDFIRYKSMEENFVITVDYCQSTLALPDKVRRLSFQFGGVKSAYIPESIIISQVRSVVFCGFYKCLPSPITDYGLLQVLLLRIWADQQNESLDLSMIHELFRLKYLKIECNITVELPGEIRRLTHLGTLHVDARLYAVPPDLVNLERLLHLRLPSECFLPHGVANMTSLRSLGYFDLNSDSQENVLHLGQLTNLQDLQLTCSAVQSPAEYLKKNVQLLGSILNKLSCLQSVTLVPSSGSSCSASISIPCDGFNMVSPPPDLLLRRIELSWRCCIFFSLPQWFVELRKLCILSIAIRKLLKKDVDILKELPSLTALTLHIQTAPAERIVIDRGGFQVLQYFKFMCAAPCLCFLQEAMPKVQKINLGFNVNKMKPYSLQVTGFGHLTCLKEICVKFGARDAEIFDRKAAESALEAALSNHPNSLIFIVECVNVIFDGEGDKSVRHFDNFSRSSSFIPSLAMLLKYEWGLDKTIKHALENLEAEVRSMQPFLEDASNMPPDQQPAPWQKVRDMWYAIEIRLHSFVASMESIKGTLLSATSMLKINHEIESYIKETRIKIKAACEQCERYGPYPLKNSLESTSTREKRVHHAMAMALAMPFGAAASGIIMPSIVKLLQYEWLLDKKVKDGLLSLQTELKSMHAFLGDVSSLAPDLQLGPQVKRQADEVSDLYHSIGTCLHSFVVRIKSSEDAHIADASKLIINHEIDVYIGGIRIKVKELHERHGPYPPKSSLESTCAQKVDPRILAKYKRESNPVGIAGAIADLTNMLSKDNHAILSIVGMGGIGKTTLAQAVYDKIKVDFDFGAFVPIGQRAGPEKVLKDIFDVLHVEIYGKEPEQLQLVYQLQEFLVHKRCLIVIDDIWDKETWTLIENVCGYSAGSKIIATTRNRKFAEEFGVIYEIKPLSTDDSRKLLRTKAKAKSGDTEFDILSDKILRKCAGVPMAITMIGSFLAKKQRSGWNREYDSIGFDEHEEDSAFEVITKVMRYSYIDLPYPIRNCFLYLSMFPKDHWIEKNMLIWRWVAEGLVPDKLFETGDSYLKELIDRSMLQWAVSPRDVGQGGCRVHSLMADLIRDLSSSHEQNFSTVLDMKQESTSQTRPIHRLAIHEKILGQNQNTSLNVGEVKSFYASTCTGSSFPPLRNFLELCVIDLEACDLSDGDCKLDDLGSKCLEYVGLLGTPLAELPKKIRDLKFIQTLDVRATDINELPSFIEELVTLRCLRAGKGTSMMGRVEKLTSLEELWLYSADKSPDFAVGLRKLSKMRVLVIHFDEIHDNMQEALVESLYELKKLQVLQVWSDAEEKVRLDCWEGCVPSRELRQLLLFGVILPRLTPWIHPLCVPKVSKILLEVVTLKAQDLKILGEMSSLRSLYLHSKDNCLSYTAGRDEFKVLEYLNTNIELVCGDGALPRIQELEIGGIRVGTDVGLQGNMPLLERASYHLDCNGCILVEIEKAEAVLRQASQAHPNYPTLSIERFNNYKIELEMQHRFIESAALEFVSTLAGGDGEAQTNAFANVWDIIARFKSAIGKPHILTMGDATDGTGSQSQSAGGVPPRRPNGEGQVLLPTRSVKGNFSTDGLLADLKGQSAAKLASTLATEVGTEPAVVMGMLEKWSQTPEFVATMNIIEWDTNGSMSASDISTLVQLLMPEIISQLGGLGGPGRGSGTFSRDSTLSTQELSDKSSEFCADSLLDRADSLGEDDAVLAPIVSLLAVPGVTTKDVAADARKSLKKESMQNPEAVVSMKSLPNTGESGPSVSHMSKLGKLMMADLMSAMDQKTGGPGRSQGAEDNLAEKHPAENSGASAAPKPTQVNSVFSLLNSPDGVDFSSVVDQFSGNPEMIASILPGLLSNPAFGSLLKNLVAQPSFMDAVASRNATMAQGAAAATETSQDGGNFLRMFNLKQLLPPMQQIFAAGERSGQASTKPDNVEIEEGAASKRP